MKVAIQLAANPRSFKRCFDSFNKNILQELNPDIFIHTWNLKGSERPDVKTDGTCEEYIDLYKPNSYQIEDLEYNYEPLQTMVPHFTSRYKTNELRKRYQEKNNIKYDVIICGRPDVKLLSPFKMEYAKMVEEDSIWIHHFKGPAQPSTRNAVPADYFFYTSPKWMDITVDCYHEMDKLNYYQPGSERLWWYKLEKEGFKYEWFKFYGNSTHDQEHINKSYRFFDIECVR
jgi:hypothetical protein